MGWFLINKEFLVPASKIEFQVPPNGVARFETGLRKGQLNSFEFMSEARALVFLKEQAGLLYKK